MYTTLNAVFFPALNSTARTYLDRHIDWLTKKISIIVMPVYSAFDRVMVTGEPFIFTISV